MTSKHITTSHRRISTRGAHTHKATSTRIKTSHRRISSRGAHRLRSQRPNQYTITTLTPVRRDRTNLPPLVPASPNTHHTHHKPQALQNLLRLIRSILPILGAVLSLLVGRIPVTKNPPKTLIRVSDTRGRVLCLKCHGENDDAFHFCQWCAAPSTYGSKDSGTALLCIDEYAIEQRFAQFTKAVAGKPFSRRRDSASLLLERFL